MTSNIFIGTVFVEVGQSRVEWTFGWRLYHIVQGKGVQKHLEKHIFWCNTKHGYSIYQPYSRLQKPKSADIPTCNPANCDLEFLESEKSQWPAAGYSSHTFRINGSNCHLAEVPHCSQSPEESKATIWVEQNKPSKQVQILLVSPNKLAGDVRIPIGCLESKWFRELSKTL